MNDVIPEINDDDAKHEWILYLLLGSSSVYIFISFQLIILNWCPFIDLQSRTEYGLTRIKINKSQYNWNTRTHTHAHTHTLQIGNWLFMFPILNELWSNNFDGSISKIGFRLIFYLYHSCSCSLHLALALLLLQNFNMQRACTIIYSPQYFQKYINSNIFK